MKADMAAADETIRKFSGDLKGHCDVLVLDEGHRRALSPVALCTLSNPSISISCRLHF